MRVLLPKTCVRIRFSPFWRLEVEVRSTFGGWEDKMAKNTQKHVFMRSFTQQSTKRTLFFFARPLWTFAKG